MAEQLDATRVVSALYASAASGDWSEVLSAAKAVFGTDRAEAMRTLHPHFFEAIQIRRRVAESELGRLQALGILEGHARGLWLLDGKGCVLHVNRAASRFMQASGGLMTTPRGLACAQADDTRKLRVAIAAGAPPRRDTTRLVIRRDADRRPLSALVTPISDGHLPMSAGAPAVILVVTAPEAVAPADAVALQRLFGLTIAEARVALAMVDAERLVDVARQLDVSLSTVRTLLQRVYAKTETHRQAELVRLLLAYGDGAASREGCRPRGGRQP